MILKTAPGVDDLNAGIGRYRLKRHKIGAGAEIHRGTLSGMLSGRTDVPPHLAERVLKVIEEMAGR